jgi:hypothetical protein
MTFRFVTGVAPEVQHVALEVERRMGFLAIRFKSGESCVALIAKRTPGSTSSPENLERR